MLSFVSLVGDMPVAIMIEISIRERPSFVVYCPDRGDRCFFLPAGLTGQAELFLEIDTLWCFHLFSGLGSFDIAEC